MGFVSKLFKLFFVAGLLLGIVSLGLPALKEQLGVKSNRVDLRFAIPFTENELLFADMPADATTQADLLMVGGILLFLGILWKIIDLNPRRILDDLKRKQEIKSELDKMTGTLNEIRRLGGR